MNAASSGANVHGARRLLREVNFFANFEGDRQFSMLRYADQLLKCLRTQYGSTCEFNRYAPRWNGNTAGGILSRWKRLFEFPMVARRHRGQINHIADHGNSHLIKFLPGERTVITCHDLIPLKLSDHLVGFSKRLKYSFRAKVVHMRKAAYIMADSESTRRDIVSLLGIPPDRIEVVYLGVNHDVFYPMAPAESKEQFKEQCRFSWPLTLLNVGASAFYKNLESGIETLGVLRQKHHLDIHLVKTSGGLSGTQRELIRQRGLAPFVHDFPVIGDSDLRNLYLASDVFLFPSLCEGFGWPPLEALACGIPVVSSDRGSLPEVLGSAALQVNPQDIQGLADSVLRALEDGRLRDDLRKAGLIQASQFQWHKTTEQVMRIYQKVWHQVGAIG